MGSSRILGGTSEVETVAGGEGDLHEMGVLQLAIPGEVVHHGDPPRLRLLPHFGPLGTRLPVPPLPQGLPPPSRGSRRHCDTNGSGAQRGEPMEGVVEREGWRRGEWEGKDGGKGLERRDAGGFKWGMCRGQEETTKDASWAHSNPGCRKTVGSSEPVRVAAHFVLHAAAEDGLIVYFKERVERLGGSIWSTYSCQEKGRKRGWLCGVKRGRVTLIHRHRKRRWSPALQRRLVSADKEYTRHEWRRRGAVVDFMELGVDRCALADVTMDAGLASGLCFHEPSVSSLKLSILLEQSTEGLEHELLCVTLELESLRANAKEEIRRREEDINQLIQRIELITHERDAARDQLQLLLDKITQANTGELSPMLPGSLQPDSSQMRQTGATSNITESDSLSGTRTHNSHSIVAFPESPSVKTANTCNMLTVQQRSSPANNSTADRASVTINSLATNKPLPQKGKLLQAVFEAGPTLQTLLLAGSLPRWRNPPPPPPPQPFQGPTPGVQAQTGSLLTPKTVPNPNSSARSSPNLINHEKSDGASIVYVQATLNSQGDAMKRQPPTSPCFISHDSMNMKRQKTQSTGRA
ncbi:hypothetical protein B296_00026999 [Ensete ventricosum]|uniref:Uncharacterized protein n=1 Tax=Ensete ventricosum TaxID=4639 RepID=A0A427A227_ENSVE|nr:hypothetical protein B296_00026999 [Ensete ventricosum]